MIKKLITGVKNRLPGGIDFRSLVHSIKLYLGNVKCDFYKRQLKHNIKAYCSTKYTPMKYELVDKPVPHTLYHITPKKNKDKILYEGLRTFCNPAVFLTSSASYVEYLKNSSKNTGDYLPESLHHGCYKGKEPIKKRAHSLPPPLLKDLC